MKLRLLAILLGAAILPACGDFEGFTVTVPPTETSATLSGTQTAPSTGTAGSGTATFTVNPAQTEIRYSLAQTGLTNVTGATIRRGEAGRDGPPLFSLSTGAFTMLSGTLNATDVLSTTFSDAVGAILNGDAYVVVNTAAFPNGELRGQIGAARLSAVRLTGEQFTPPDLTTPASAAAEIQLSPLQDEFTLGITTSGLTGTDVSSVRIVSAGGNVLLTPFTGAGFGSPFSTTVTDATFTASPGEGINTFSDAVNAMLSGTASLQIVTTTGGIASRIGPARLNASLDTLQNVGTPIGLPPAPPFPSGTGLLVLNGRQTSIATTLAMSDLTSATVSGGLRLGPPGVNGPLLLPVFVGAVGSPVLTLSDAANLNLLSGITSFPGVVEALLTSGAYLEVRTATNTSGELRGQILP